MKTIFKKSSWGILGSKSILSIALISPFIIGCGSGGSSTATTTSSSTTVTAVDGYIIDATIKDATGKVATDIGGGKYKFTDKPAYPLTLIGGKYAATNKPFDINLSTESGEVISPITTFLAEDTALAQKLISANLGATSIEDLSSDYIEKNNLNLAKLSELLYVILKDTTLTTSFKNTLNGANPTSLDDIFTLAETDINSTASMDFIKKYYARKLLSSIKDYNGTVADMEVALKDEKDFLNGDYTAQKRVVLKTGQTKSYDENGTEVTDGSIKDDGYYQKGVDRSYTRDDTKEIVTDNATGLMWQDNVDVESVKKQWLTDENYNTCSNDTNSSACFDTSGDTAATYCENLTLGGYDDWRLPTQDELKTIVDIGKSDPAIDSAFTNVASAGYWSSSSVLSYPYYAWGVLFFLNGHDAWTFKDDNYYVRCVRSGQ